MAGAKKPLIILGSEALQGDKGTSILARLQQLSSQLSSKLDGLFLFHNMVLGKTRVLNVLHRWASQVGALDVGYKPGVAAIRKKPIRFLYLFGADEGRVTRSNLDSDAFIVYQGLNFSSC